MEKDVMIELTDNESGCKLIVNGISLEDIVKKYEIVKEGGEMADLVLTIPLNKVELNALNLFYLSK